MPLVEEVGGPILPEDCQDQNQKRKFTVVLLHRIAASLVLPLFRLPLVPSGVIEFIGFDGPLQVAIRLVGQGGVTQPPAPAIAGTDMDTQLPRNAMGRAREAHQKGGQHPVQERPLALGEQRLGEVVESTPTVFAAVAFESGSVMVTAPGLPGLVRR